MPTGSAAEQSKFSARRNITLANIFLSVDTSLTRLDLCQKLHSFQLKDRESAQAHVKVMTELYDSLSVAGETVSEEDCVVCLLAEACQSLTLVW